MAAVHEQNDEDWFRRPRTHAGMMRYDRKFRVLAVCFSGIAGYVDAIGFLMSEGFFVSFMSGNSTRMGIGVAAGSTSAGFALGLVATFVAGVMLGTIAGRVAKANCRPAVLALVTVLLAAGLGLHWLGAGLLVVFLLALAMGAENTVFAEDGEVRIGLTYMTGTLVKLGTRLAIALLGGDSMGWLPYMLLWSGLLIGAIAGAIAYDIFGINALLAAVLAMAALSGIAMGLVDGHDPAPEKAQPDQR